MGNKELMKKHDRTCDSRCLGPMNFLLEQDGQGGCLATGDTLSPTNGLIFLCRPVKMNEKIHIRIESRDFQRAFRIGFTNTHPRTFLFPPTTLRDPPQCCVVPVPDELYQRGEEIEFWLNYAPSVMIRGMDGKKYFMKAKGLDVREPLYVFLDLFRSSSAVRLLGSRKGDRKSCPVPPDQSYTATVNDQAAKENLLNFSLIADQNVHSEQRAFRETSTWPTRPALSPVSTLESEPSTDWQTSGSRELHVTHQSSKEEKDVTNLLRDFQQQYVSSDTVRVVVWKKKLLASALVALSNRSFSWTMTPQIEFPGEEAFDKGAPRREFFRLLMFEVKSFLGILKGKPGHLFFTYDQSALHQRRYEDAGKMVAWSIIHGGPGLKSLDPCLYRLMCGVETDLKYFDLHLIPDADVQKKAQKILSCRTNAQLRSLQSAFGDWICDCGFPGIYRPDVSIQDIPKIYSYIVKHYIYLRVSNMVDQFIKGMNSYGRLWDMVKANWIEFMPLFTKTSERISRASFMAMFQISWSKEGPKKRNAEKETINHWESVLKMIEDKETDLGFEELLIFITAADEIPALGFPQKLTINFYDPEWRCFRLPYASTCKTGLFLPRGVNNPVTLNKLLLRAVRDSHWFGKYIYLK